MEPIDFPGVVQGGSEDSPLFERLFWPLILCLTYFCAAMLLATALA